jgi:hypothetical protein
MKHQLNPDPWYFSRKPFALQIIQSFEGGLVSSIALFAPRRMGKTEFVLRDLIPAYEEKGGEAVYCNLWERQSSPESIILDAIQRHLESLHVPKGKKTAKVATKLNLGIVEATAEVGEERAAKTLPPDVPAALKAWGAHLRGKKQIGLLVIDEVQHLASSKAFAEFTASLRTVLEQHADCIKVVFTGSSQIGLARMFQDTKAPFYGPGSTMFLPMLGADFVQHIAKRAKDVYKAVFSEDEIASALALHNGSPYFLRHALNHAAANGVGLHAAALSIAQILFDSSGLREKWDALNPLEQIVLRLVCMREPLYSNDTLSKVSQLTRAPAHARQVQVAVEKLTRSGWIEKALDGKYAPADPLVATAFTPATITP